MLGVPLRQRLLVYSFSSRPAIIQPRFRRSRRQLASRSRANSQLVTAMVTQLPSPLPRPIRYDTRCTSSITVNYALCKSPCVVKINDHASAANRPATEWPQVRRQISGKSVTIPLSAFPWRNGTSRRCKPPTSPRVGNDQLDREKKTHGLYAAGA